MPATYETDAFCFLNLENPVCAWAAYRGVLVQPPSEPGFLSVWVATMLFANSPYRVKREFMLEAIRAAEFPDQTSRLRGMYVFPDKLAALRAVNWGGHFCKENLSELSLTEATLGERRYDANWISYPRLKDDKAVPDWMHRYWAGEPHPEHEPVWEALAEGRVVLLGTELRQRAFEQLSNEFPDSTALLETARLAAWIGSDLGNVAAFLRVHDQIASLDYLLDMRAASDPDVVRQLGELRESGHPINWPAIGESIQLGSFVLPDLRPYGFRRPLAEMPYLFQPTSAA